MRARDPEAGFTRLPRVKAVRPIRPLMGAVIEVYPRLIRTILRFALAASRCARVRSFSATALSRSVADTPPERTVRARFKYWRALW